MTTQDVPKQPLPEGEIDVDALDKSNAADDPLADKNPEDTPDGFFDGDGSDEGVVS